MHACAQHTLATLLGLVLSTYLISGYTTESPGTKPRGPIFLYEPPEHVIIPNNKGAIIPCGVYGNPAPLVTWSTADGVEVARLPGVMEVLHNHSLYFRPFNAEDVEPGVHTQTYRCVAENRVGTIISRKVNTVAVIVDQLERFTVNVNDVWVMRGGTAVFKCEINPSFWSDYVTITGWTQGTRNIRSGGRFSMTPDGELHVRDVRDTDGLTDFYCMATSDVAGIQKTSPPAKLNIHDPPAGGSLPSLEVDPVVSLKRMVGASVELTCVANGWPLPTYRWYKSDGVVLDVTGPRFSQYGGHLVISELVPGDAGVYRCNASNIRGSVTAERHLFVKSPLKAVIHPPNQTVDSGQRAFFNCSVTSSPQAIVVWYKNGQPLEPDVRHVYKSDTVLEIDGVERPDQGMYQCFVSDDGEETQAGAQLLLGAEKPTILGYGSQFVQRGQRASVRCQASGKPTPTLVWILDGQPLRERSNVNFGDFRSANDDVISYVNISSVTLQDGGDYVCIAKNDAGKAQHVSRLNVYGEPYIREMRNVTATANEPLEIKCYVTGFPIASISWYRDNHQLPLNHLQHVVNGTLTILKVQKHYDAGRYTCIAVNAAGKGMQRDVFVSVVEPPVIDPFRIPDRKQGDRVTLSCAVSNGDLPIYISWTKDGRPIPPDIGVIVETSGSYSSLLKIDDVSPVHDGNYTCHAYNEAASTNFTAVLHVDVPPRWIAEPEDSTVIRKDSVTLPCLATGIPEPKITWSENIGGYPPRYVPLDVTRADQYDVYENGTLQIYAALEEDDGYYLCRADNGIGHGISKIVYLKVHVPARFDISEKAQSVLRGHNVTLDCQAIGDKPLSVSWNFKNSTWGRGNFGSRHTVHAQNTTRGMLSQLSVHPATREDTGVYTCTAANTYGFDSTTIYLTIQEPPDAPENLALKETGSRYVVLVWSRAFDGNSNILQYIIEYQNNSGESRGPVKNVSVAGNAVTARLEGLHPSYMYDIRIRAENTIGLGLTSHQISAKMLEEAPSGPAKEVKVTALGSEKLQVTWKPPALEQRNGIILGYYVGYQETQTQTTEPHSPEYITQEVDSAHGDPEAEVSVIIANLKKFTEYKVHVACYNSKGPGPQSPDVTVTTLEDVPSQPPEGVHAYAVSSETISVAWGPPPLYNLHGVLQGYMVIYKPVRKDEDETDSNFLKSDGLDVTLTQLQKYTNYSIQVLAYTRKGEGVRSNPIHIRTLEDVPGRPAGIKALTVNNSAIVVSWRPPVKHNGVLVAYSIYYSNTSANAQELKLDVSPDLSYYVITDLDGDATYRVRVTASTRMGEGESTQIVTVTTHDHAPARIVSFSLEVVVSWQGRVLLPCIAVGDPEPNVSWNTSYGSVDNTDRHSVMNNGSLHMVAVIGNDADNYTCSAKNAHGSDVITYSLSVQVYANTKTPPKAPLLSLAAMTSSTIQVNWISGSNGGSPIVGFLLRYRKEHDGWQEVHVGPRNRTYTATGLRCGTAFKFSITALNNIGRSESSNVVSANTVGAPPIAPTANEMLRTVNATSIELDLRAWRRDVCGIHFYSVQYQSLGTNNGEWVEANNHINWNTTLHTVEDLQPATRYTMKVTAYSDAGSTECKIVFATLTYTGGTLQPLSVFHKDESYFYEKLYIMVPLCTAFVILIVVCVGVALFCFRRRQIIRYKDTSINIRRDITAETTLMNDLDKRLNSEPESPGDCRFQCRNVNLLVSLQSDDNLSGNNSPWCFHDTSKTNSDNASLERYEEDANINPYATFNELKLELTFPDNPTYHKPDPESEDDSICLEKAQAQKAMQAVGESTKGPKYPPKALGPPPSGAQQHSYDNQAAVLSPRKYASADQIHALFTMAPPRPQSAYSKNRSQGTRSTPSEKGSQRHSLISSVTTVSSSRDELMEAFENLNRNPPPPVVYETEADSLSQPTDSSSTEPGICLFTESPPQPNERREASCEVPRYESPDGSQYKEAPPPVASRHDLDTRGNIRAEEAFDPRAGTLDSRTGTLDSRGGTFDPRAGTFDPRVGTFDPRASSGSRRAARPCSVQKNKDSATQHIGGQNPAMSYAQHRGTPGPMGTTRGNTRPRCIEEVTYTFNDGDSPVRSRKAQSSRPVRDDRPTSVWRRGGRRTPHARTRYDTSLRTPGTADNKPLVASAVMTSQDESPEDEESVSLLDRFYRPVPAKRKDVLHLEDEGDEYTENFTVV